MAARFRIVFLAIILVAMETVSAWLLEHGNVLNPVDPPLFHLLDPARSIYAAVLQFFSAMLTGITIVATCIFKLHGWADFRSFQRFDLELAQEFREVLVSFSVWSWIRGPQRLNQWPWPVIACADSERTPADRISMSKKFMATTKHDADEGIGAVLLDECVTWRDIFSRRIQGKLFRVAMLHLMHSGGVENRHAAQRRLLSSRTEHVLYCARSINSEVQRNVNEVREQLRPREQGEATQVGVATPPAVRRGVLGHYLSRCVPRDRPACNGCSKPYWDKVRAEWDQLPAHEKDAFTTFHEDELRREASEKRARRLGPSQPPSEEQPRQTAEAAQPGPEPDLPESDP